VRDFTGHQKLERVLRSGIVGEIDQSLVHNLRPRFRGDIAAKVDVELAGNLQIVCGSRVALRIKEIDPATSAIAISGSRSAASRSISSV
jgi:hypothetical protein